ncbi:hypothetical protein GBA52_000989 [Prunus armeniaca]|nr:hypothetical protein GBA52_000989 [Prunus armeniaca]
MNYVAPLSGTRGKTTPRHASCAASLDHGDGTRSKHAPKQENRNPTPAGLINSSVVPFVGCGPHFRARPQSQSLVRYYLCLVWQKEKAKEEGTISLFGINPTTPTLVGD